MSAELTVRNGYSPTLDEGNGVPTINNKTQKPLRIPLPRGKTLHLGLAGRGQVPDDVLDRPAFRKLVAAGEIELLGEGDRSVASDKTSTPIGRSSPGHPAVRNVARKGDR